jgi:hypothetical protein
MDRISDAARQACGEAAARWRSWGNAQAVTGATLKQSWESPSYFKLSDNMAALNLAQGHCLSATKEYSRVLRRRRLEPIPSSHRDAPYSKLQEWTLGGSLIFAYMGLSWVCAHAGAIVRDPDECPEAAAKRWVLAENKKIGQHVPIPRATRWTIGTENRCVQNKPLNDERNHYQDALQGPKVCEEVESVCIV